MPIHTQGRAQSEQDKGNVGHDSAPELSTPVSNAQLQSQIQGSDDVCTDPVADFSADIESGDLVAALTSMGALSPEDWDRLTRDDGVAAKIPKKFLMDEAIVLLDATPFETVRTFFLHGTEQLKEASSTCSAALTDLLQRHPQGAIALIGIAALPDVGTQMEALGQAITDLTQQTGSQVFEILSGMSQDARRAGMIALHETGGLEMFVADDEGNVYGYFLEYLPAQDVHLLTDLIQGSDKSQEDVEEEAKKSENPERAKKALEELKAKQGSESEEPKRLTDGIVNLLVWGVGKAMNDTDLGKEGIIGIHHAVNAADALIGMPLDMYKGLASKLVMAGGKNGDAQVESVLILKAVAARKQEFTGKKTEEDQKKADEDVAKFADEIRGSDVEKLKKETALRDTGGGEGLQQKYTMTCGPTSIQMTRGGSDPIFAKEVSGTAKHTLDYDNKVGDQQKDYLGKAAVPRVVMNAWKTFQADIQAWVAGDATKAPAAQALVNHIMGNAADATKLTAGKAWAAGAGYKADRIAEFKKFYPFNAPGWGNNEFQTKANSEIADATNATFNERAIPPQYKNIAGKMRPVSTMKKADCDALYEALFRGKDIPMGIMWYGGGGHFMVFTDCKTEKQGGKDVRSFLLSDPWEGKSAWITEANVIAGDCSPHGKGAIDSIYL